MILQFLQVGQALCLLLQPYPSAHLSHCFLPYGSYKSCNIKSIGAFSSLLYPASEKDGSGKNSIGLSEEPRPSCRSVLSSFNISNLCSLPTIFSVEYHLASPSFHTLLLSEIQLYNDVSSSYFHFCNYNQHQQFPYKGV